MDDNAFYIEPEDVDEYLYEQVPDAHKERVGATLKELHTSEEADE